MIIRILKRTALVLVELLAVLVSIAVAAELVLRMSFYLANDPAAREAFEYKIMLAGRIQGYWLQPTPEHDFVPPFETFADRGSDDPERLRKIFEATRLPPSRTWTSYDFLQAPERAEQTKYVIHSNALGFRGKEARREKPAGTFRVIVLGSYQAFGHGVGDDEAYPARLEAELNRRLGKPGRRFEVWNGGKHAGTAIIGLARLKNEIFNYKPDLLIFDYGMVDNNIWDDNFFPSPMGLPDQGIFRPLKPLLLSLRPYFQRSYLIAKIRNGIFRRTDNDRVRKFLEVLERMASLCRRNHVPFLLVRQLPVFNFAEREYLHATMAEPGQFVDVGEVFRLHPMPRSSNGEPRNDWTSEIRLAATLNQEWAFQHYDYRLDFYQLNSLGHRVLATALADRIQRLLSPAGGVTLSGNR